MTARQPRRRRRTVAAAPLPRPGGEESTLSLDGEDATPAPTTGRRSGPRRPQLREHHVTTDYGYVHRDLALIGVLTVLILAFIGVMAFVIS